MHSRTRAFGMMALVLCGASSRCAAELVLPNKVIVVRDFARKQQDLLDTLKVNVPDAKVSIEQFRGSEVVLLIKVPAHKVSNKRSAALALRRHCDKVIRKAYPGMTMSKESRVSFVKPRPAKRAQAPRTAKKTGLIGRLRGALSELNDPDKPETEGALAPEIRIPGEPSASDLAEKNGYLESLRSSTEKRYKKLIARAKGEAPPPLAPATTRSSTAGALSPETTERMARFPAVAAPPAKGLAQSVLAERSKRRELLSRIHKSDALSPATKAAMARGTVPEASFGAPEIKASTYATIRGIYAEIYSDRKRSTPGDAVVALVPPVRTSSVRSNSVNPPKLANPFPAKARSSTKRPLAVGLSPPPSPKAASDAALSDKIAALFDSVKRAEESTN